MGFQETQDSQETQSVRRVKRPLSRCRLQNVNNENSQRKQKPIRLPLPSGSKIRLQSKATNQYLRIKQDGSVDFQGGEGPYTLFKVKSPKKFEDSQHQILKLNSVQNPDYYLRLNRQMELDGLGHGGKWTLFEMILNENGTVSLNSVVHQTKIKYEKENKEETKKEEQEEEQEEKEQEETNDQFSLKVVHYGKKNQKPLYWVFMETKSGKLENIPKNAVEAGQEMGGEKLYVCRVFHNGSWHPGKFGLHLPGAHFPYGDRELVSSKFQILCGKGAKWQKFPLKSVKFLTSYCEHSPLRRIKDSSSLIPKDSFISGSETIVEKKLYVIRALIYGGLHCGKYGIHLNEGAHISFGGQVTFTWDFEILVL